MGLPLLLRGKYLSHTERPATLLSASQTPDPLFPLARLGDGRPSQLFMFPSRLEDDWWQAEINQYLNGSFENWTDGEPNDHTVNTTGTATIVEETVSPVFAGGSSMELNNGASGTIEVLQSIEAIAGESIELRYAAQTNNADSPATLEILNPYTRKWLTTAGTWSSKRQNAIEEAGTSFPSVLDVLTFTVENFSTVRNHIVELEIRYHMDGAAATRIHHWDGIEWIPETNFTSIHAHNLSPNIVPRLVSSDESLEAVPVDHAIRFDGSSYLTRSTDFDGLADGKTGIISLWVKLETDGVNQTFFGNNLNRFEFRANTDNSISLFASNSAGTLIVDQTTAASVISADGSWHHLLLAFDLAASFCELYIDDVNTAVGVLLTDDFIDFTTGSWGLGARSDGTLPFTGQLGDVYVALNQFVDITVAKNRALFRNSVGKPPLLGDAAELPTGTSPTVYWRGIEISSNLGTGGDYDGTTGTPVVAVQLEAELVKQDIAFYSKLVTSNIRRFWKFHLKGLNAIDAIETGLWVIGSAVTPAWSPRLGLSETRRFPQSVSVVESSGEQWRTRRAKHPRRSASLSFRLKNVQQAAFRDELIARTSQGVDAIVLVENQNATKVVHGRIPPESEFVFRSFEAEEVDMVVEESSNGIGLQL